MAKYKKHLKFLDKILKLLLKNTHRSLDFETIVKELKLSKVKGEFFGNPVNFIPIGEKYNIHFDLATALDYLVKEGFIYYLIDGYRISYKGIIKLKTDPFIEEINKREWGTKRERMLLIITAISLAFAFLKDLLKLFSC